MAAPSHIRKYLPPKQAPSRLLDPIDELNESFGMLMGDPSEPDWPMNDDFNRIMGVLMPTSQNAPQSSMSFHDRAKGLLMSRLHGMRGMAPMVADDFLHCHVSNDTVYVFFLIGGREGIIQENIDVFPSDTLITQIRMVMA